MRYLKRNFFVFNLSDSKSDRNSKQFIYIDNLSENNVCSEAADKIFQRYNLIDFNNI